MSSTLVRKSLEVTDSDITNPPGKNQDKSKQKKSGTGLRMVKKQKKSGTGLRTVKKRMKKSQKKGEHMTVEELRMRLRVHEDHTEGNVCFLQRLAVNKIDEAAANKIFARAVKVQKDQLEPECKPESTVFTEEDFEKFEKEYFAC